MRLFFRLIFTTAIVIQGMCACSDEDKNPIKDGPLPFDVRFEGAVDVKVGTDGFYICTVEPEGGIFSEEDDVCSSLIYMEPSNTGYVYHRILRAASPPDTIFKAEWGCIKESGAETPYAKTFTVNANTTGKTRNIKIVFDGGNTSYYATIRQAPLKPTGAE